MFGFKSFLSLGSDAEDFVSLIQGGYELSDFSFNFTQGTDSNGNVSTAVRGGDLRLTIPFFPSDNVVEWMLNSKKYKDGVIVVVDVNNQSIQKVYFKNAACVSMNLTFIDKGSSYTSTTLQLRAESIGLNTFMDFENLWTEY